MAEYHRLRIATLVAIYVAGISAAYWLDWPLALVVASNLFSASYLALALSTIDRCDGRSMRMVARTSNIPAYVIFTVTTGAAATALLALFLVLKADEKVSGIWMAFALLAIPLGWATVHMMAAFHYAYLYWTGSSDGMTGPALDFPGEANPDGWDFVYFSFVIGMTAQTADVTLPGRSARRFALVHSIFAYFFNTVLVAAAVNVAVAT